MGSLWEWKKKPLKERQWESCAEWCVQCHPPSTLNTVIDLTLRQTQPDNIGARTYMKENIFSPGGGRRGRSQMAQRLKSTFWLKLKFSAIATKVWIAIASQKRYKEMDGAGEGGAEGQGVLKWHWGQRKKKHPPSSPRAASWRCSRHWCKKNKSVPNGPQQPLSIMY